MICILHIVNFAILYPSHPLLWKQGIPFVLLLKFPSFLAFFLSSFLSLLCHSQLARKNCGTLRTVPSIADVDLYPQPIYIVFPVGCAHVSLHWVWIWKFAYTTNIWTAVVCLCGCLSNGPTAVHTVWNGWCHNLKGDTAFLPRGTGSLILLEIFNFLFVLFEAKLELHCYIIPSR
jgi:hypothetical protein